MNNELFCLLCQSGRTTNNASVVPPHLLQDLKHGSFHKSLSLPIHSQAKRKKLKMLPGTTARNHISKKHRSRQMQGNCGVKLAETRRATIICRKRTRFHYHATQIVRPGHDHVACSAKPLAIGRIYHKFLCFGNSNFFILGVHQVDGCPSTCKSGRGSPFLRFPRTRKVSSFELCISQPD